MTSHRFPARHPLPAAALCLALGGLFLLAACSSAGGGTTGQPTATAQATKPPVQTQTTSTGQAAAKSPTPAASATIEPCSLLTKEEVEAVIGNPVDPVKITTGDANAISCEYQIPDRKPQRYVGLVVYISTPAQAKGMHEATKGGGRDQTPVAGLGDDAYWDKTFRQLSILKGKYAIALDATVGSVDDSLKATQALAPKLLARLP